MDHAAKGRLFDNCIIQAPDGVLLGRCAQKKIDWYLTRGMATLVCEDPVTIRLNFEPSGRKGADDPFNMTGKPNHCVVCGAKENLNRHHVIPYSIIKHFPVQFKNHNAHDVLPMCLPCHRAYEDRSDEKRYAISREIKIPVHGTTRELVEVRKAEALARCFVEHGHKMPEDRRNEVLAGIVELIGPVSHEQILLMAKKRPGRRDTGYESFGKQVADQVTDHNAFAAEWRQHFLDTMKPKFMPEHWNVHRRFEDQWVPQRFLKNRDIKSNLVV